MAINFPSSIDALTNPATGDSTTSPSHAGQHSDSNDAIEALEAKVGADASAVTTSHDYKLSGVTGTDKAVSKTGAEVLTNKTLTSPVINTPTGIVKGDVGLGNVDNTSDATKNSATANLTNKVFSPKSFGMEVFSSGVNMSTGDAKRFFRIPASLNGFNLTAVAASVYTAGTTGTTDIQIRNKTQTADMLSTKLTIDSGETDTSTAAAAVIDAANDDVATGDVIAIDVDAVHTTPAQGLWVEFTFALP
jgi:lipopolysaccharide export system protein LptC